MAIDVCPAILASVQYCNLVGKLHPHAGSHGQDAPGRRRLAVSHAQGTAPAIDPSDRFSTQPETLFGVHPGIYEQGGNGGQQLRGRR